ncbi:hypothetical protein [Persicirhabdus sediminis]|uniref:PQQ-like domain-containing protein n=1 Tax=Persicirhabdus sediminis TaxID=454144 RepID=A0A8J7MFZ0_9BACT|nr:hypothetical protein [Persicirhabdus sediminis]MBK1792038.1 hypothetical protein [Persicirhabdus sediminis]
MKTLLGILALATIGVAGAAEDYAGKLPAGSGFIFSVHAGDQRDEIAVSTPAGEIVWTNKDKLVHPQLFELQDDGSVLVGTQDGAHMLGLDGKNIWQYKVPKDTQNCFAMKLGDDRFLIGNEGHSKFAEINSAGEVLKETSLQGIEFKKHGQFRYCSITPEGNYLVPVLFMKTLREYTPEGEIISEVKNLPSVTRGERLANGHTLVSSRGKLQEYDKDWKVVWEFSLSKDAKIKDCPITSFTVLDGDNYLLALYHSSEEPNFIEISRDKKVVHKWTFPQYKRVAFVTVVPAANPLMKSLK